MLPLRVVDGAVAAVATRTAWRWRSTGVEEFADEVVVEETLTVLLRHRGDEHVLGSTMRTPGDDDELAVGLAVGEGVVTGASEIRSVVADPGCESGARVVLTVADDVDVDASRLGRVTGPTSACGVCGRDDLDALVAAARARPWPVVPPPLPVLAALPDRLGSSQPVFRRTGGLHAAGLADGDGGLFAVREDVGRHNAVDKVVGRALLDGRSPAALVVSGRAGFEIVQKAVAAGVPSLVSVSATTSRAVEAARAAGLTLACFARDGRMTVYSGPDDRVASDAVPPAATSW